MIRRTYDADSARVRWLIGWVCAVGGYVWVLTSLWCAAFRYPDDWVVYTLVDGPLGCTMTWMGGYIWRDVRRAGW